MRAREPDDSGYVTRDGESLYYEVFGTGSATLFFLPTWSLVHSRVWKAQIPYFARHFRALTFDGRGNGKSSRPVEPSAYTRQMFADDAIAVMDATKTDKAIVVGFSVSGIDTAMLAADHPNRIAGAIFICPVSPFGEMLSERKFSWRDELSTTEGWAKHNRHYWLRDYEGWLQFFAGKLFTEPHSTKQIEDVIGWGRETTPEILIATYEGEEPATSSFADATKAKEAYSRIRCPVLVIHGSDDAVVSTKRGAGVAEATNGTLVILQGAGHVPHARDPVKVNLTMRAFAERVEPQKAPLRRWPRGHRRRKRALYISSPIGLGHAQRDVAIARELHRIRPDLGPNLPLISEWTNAHFDFSGYITGFDPAQFADRAKLREELGYGPDETVCIVTVGGSGVGAPLLRRVIDAYPLAKQRVPSLRMIVVAGPRIDPASLPAADGLEVKQYVHELYRHLAACEIAIVQGGLSTTMELAANRRPFLYFPLRHHFEQNFHVRHRLERYGAGRCMDYELATPEVIADALAEELGKPVNSKPVESDGAARAAARIAELI